MRTRRPLPILPTCPPAALPCLGGAASRFMINPMLYLALLIWLLLELVCWGYISFRPLYSYHPRSSLGIWYEYLSDTMNNSGWWVLVGLIVVLQCLGIWFQRDVRRMKMFKELFILGFMVFMILLALGMLNGMFSFLYVP